MSSQKIVESIINDAITNASRLRHQYVTLEHILVSLMSNEDIQGVCKKNKVDTEQITQDAQNYLAENTPVYRQGWDLAPKRTFAVDRVVQRAVAQASFSNRATITPLDLLASILTEDESHARYFCGVNGLTADLLQETVEKEASSEEALEMLREFTTNLNGLAENSEIDPLIGREKEVSDLVHILARRKKNNCVMVGEPGTGKTAIAEGLAKKIVEGDVPENMENKTVYSMDIGSLLAGTRYRGDFEERFRGVLQALEADDDAVLFIDEVHMIMGAGASGQGNIDAANLLKPVLGRGKLLTIGATTPDEFANTFEKDHALMRRFARLDVSETDVDSTKAIVRGLRHHYEQFHGVTYDELVLERSVDLTDRYVKTRYFPDKALDVIDAAGARVKLRGDHTVEIADIVHVISKISKIGEDMIDVENLGGYEHLADNIKHKIYGQEEAVDRITEAILVSKAGLREPNKPVGSFLFVGPTGTGKTETARCLADEMNSELVKFDMSEYGERHSVSKLIGAPPGYVGHAEGKMGQGQLLAAVDETPNCVLLLDEVEKAAPEVLQVLLQIMDDGVLTGAAGKKVDFSNVILIMTSNLGAADAEKPRIGFGNADQESNVTQDAVNGFFPPEFRNRLDATVKFAKLDPEQMVLITDRLITETNTMLSKNSSKVRIQLTPEARNKLSQDGYDPALGARPLKRVFEEKIKKPLSRHLLFNDLKQGMVTIDYDQDRDEYDFQFQS